MMKFKGNRKIAEVKKAVLAAGGEWSDEKYNQGSDYITFRYKGREVQWNAFNGRFYVYAGRHLVTELDTRMERYKWYVDLLNLLYMPLPVKKKAME